MNIRKLIARQPFSPLGLVAIAAGLLIVALAWFAFSTWQHDRRAAVEAKADRAMGAAHVRSAADAMGTVTAAEKRGDAIDQQVKEAEDEIRNAAEADRNSVALARLCMSDAARDDRACRELRKPRTP